MIFGYFNLTLSFISFASLNCIKALTVQSPIGKLILLSYQESALLNNPLLEEKLNNLIDLIKFRTVNKGFEQTSHSLQNELFNVRMELLSLLFSQPEMLKTLQDRILDDIAEKYFLKGPNKQLGLVVSNALEVYLGMFSKLADLIVEQESPDFPKGDIPSFEAFKFALSLQPTLEFANYLRWLESSLNFDYLLIVADFFLYQEIELDSKQVKELEELVRETIINFASYTTITGYWDFQENKSIPYFEEISKRVNSIRLYQNPTVYFRSSGQKQKENSARDFVGLWSKEDADLIEKAIQDGCEQIDEDGWK